MKSEELGNCKEIGKVMEAGVGFDLARFSCVDFYNSASFCKIFSCVMCCGKHCPSSLLLYKSFITLTLEKVS